MKKNSIAIAAARTPANPLSSGAALLVVPVLKGREKRSAAKAKRKGTEKRPAGGRPEQQLPAFAAERLPASLRTRDFKGSTDERLLVAVNGGGAVAMLLVGFDAAPESKFDRLRNFRKLGSAVVSAARNAEAAEAALYADELGAFDAQALAAFAEGVHLSGYRFEEYKGAGKAKPDAGKKPELRTVTVFSKRALDRRALGEGEVLSRATSFARDLVNTPPGDLTPRRLADAARDAAKRAGLQTAVHDRAALKKLGAGGLLGVAAGSSEPPFLVKLAYRPKRRAKRKLALVGKGVTFDSGGLSIKSGAGMESMKCDMSGAAAVIAAACAAAELELPVEIDAYVPATENMINGEATRPGDVLRLMNGKTVEVLNTDAEGRLILADALVLAERGKPDCIVDVATLTGACVVALGPEYAGLFSDDERVVRRLLRAAEAAGERLWRMPLAPEYRAMLESPVADLKNIGSPKGGGAITAALFLKEFVERTPWAHLDIAGPAFTDGDAGYIRRGGVGFAVRTLVHFARAFA